MTSALSDPIACETHGASRERQTSRVVCVGLQFKVQRLRRTPCFRNNWVFREVTPVGHSNLKTYRMDYRERPELKSGIFARRTIVDQARQGLATREKLNILVYLT